MDIIAVNKKYNENGSIKEYKLCINYWFEDCDEEDEFQTETIGYFNTIAEAKEYINDPDMRQEIEECYIGCTERKFGISRTRLPYSNWKELKEQQTKEDEDEYFCPYCGKYREFYVVENGDTVCDMCGVSIKEYYVVVANDLVD